MRVILRYVNVFEEYLFVKKTLFFPKFKSDEVAHSLNKAQILYYTW